MYARSHHVSHQSQRFSKRKRNRSVIAAVLIVAAISIWVFCFVRFTWLDALNVDSVVVAGTDDATAIKLQASVLDSMRGEYLGLIPRANTLLYPKSAIVMGLKKMAPSIAVVDISRKGGKTLGIDITEKVPSAIICVSYPDNTSGSFQFEKDESCYYADSSAYIFKKAPDISGNAYHRYYVPSITDDTSSTTAIIGTYAMPGVDFDGLERFYTALIESGITPNAVLLKDDGEYELYADNPTAKVDPDTNVNDIIVIYFNKSRSLDDQFSNLTSFWANMVGKSKMKDPNTSFDYIDVRYGANVFYK